MPWLACWADVPFVADLSAPAYSVECGAKIEVAREEPVVAGKDTGPQRSELRDNDPEFRGKGLLSEQLYIVFSLTFLPNKGENLCSHRSFAFPRAKATLSWRYTLCWRGRPCTHAPDMSVLPKGRSEKFKNFQRHESLDARTLSLSFLFPLPDQLRVCHFNSGQPSGTFHICIISPPQLKVVLSYLLRAWFQDGWGRLLSGSVMWRFPEDFTTLSPLPFSW